MIVTGATQLGIAIRGASTFITCGLVATGYGMWTGILRRGLIRRDLLLTNIFAIFLIHLFLAYVSRFFNSYCYEISFTRFPHSIKETAVPFIFSKRNTSKFHGISTFFRYNSPRQTYLLFRVKTNYSLSLLNSFSPLTSRTCTFLKTVSITSVTVNSTSFCTCTWSNTQLNQVITPSF